MPKSSLASVGVIIGNLVITACISMMGIALALLTLFFAREPNWARPALMTIAVFSVSGVIALKFGGRRFRKAKEVPK